MLLFSSYNGKETIISPLLKEKRSGYRLQHPISHKRRKQDLPFFNSPRGSWTKDYRLRETFSIYSRPCSTGPCFLDPLTSCWRKSTTNNKDKMNARDRKACWPYPSSILTASPLCLRTSGASSMRVVRGVSPKQLNSGLCCFRVPPAFGKDTPNGTLP